MLTERDLINTAETAPDFWLSVTSTEFLADVHRRMSDLGVSRAELARRIGTSKPYVTSILAGNRNFTLVTMIKIAMALDGIVHTHIADRNVVTYWNDVDFNNQARIVTHRDSDEFVAPSEASDSLGRMTVIGER